MIHVVIWLKSRSKLHKPLGLCVGKRDIVFFSLWCVGAVMEVTLCTTKLRCAPWCTRCKIIRVDNVTLYQCTHRWCTILPCTDEVMHRADPDIHRHKVGAQCSLVSLGVCLLLVRDSDQRWGSLPSRQDKTNQNTKLKFCFDTCIYLHSLHIDFNTPIKTYHKI